MRSIAVVIFITVLTTFHSVSFATQTGHQPWADTVFTYIKKTYGPTAEQRMRKIESIIAINYNKPVMQKLDITNYAMNHLPWIADRKKYNADDYWATPLETIATFGGDCEDIAISKFVMLRHMGIPAKHLRLAYVKIIRTGESHMVLLYVENPHLPIPQQRSLVLDNYVGRILPGKERTDLIAVYAVDGDNNVVLFNDDGVKRTVKATVSKAKYAKLDKVKEQIAANQDKYQALNGGRPLY
ncbi:MAG: hypothetical protein HOC23_06225 [Halieaceae bacterium]|jgi:predicted transglutaminase-like cysteine proteinase|nr:hypothetical protein [Halieaceae bacterium]